MQSSAVFRLMAVVAKLPRDKGVASRLPGIGIFIESRHFGYLVASYANLVNGLIRRPLKHSEVREEILGVCDPGLCYLQDGPAMRVGYVVPEHHCKFLRGELPVVTGRLTSCATFLHPADPVLLESPRIQPCEVAYGYPCVAKFEFDDFSCSVSVHALNRFMERGLKFKPIRDRLPPGPAPVARRDAIKVLYDLVGASKEAHRRNGCMQQAMHGDEAAKYRVWGNWVFVMTDTRVLKTLYAKEDVRAGGYLLLADSCENEAPPG